MMTKAAKSVWNNCLSFIKDNIQEQAYKTWFEPIVAISLSEDNALHIQVPRLALRELRSCAGADVTH